MRKSQAHRVEDAARVLSRICGRKRGQQALEYLITYGWAFVVILLTIGAFAYFGLLSPTRYLPERCDFGVQMLCADYVLESADPDAGQVKLRIQNAYGHDIAIWDMKTVQGTGSFTIQPVGGGSGPTIAKVLDGEVSDALVLDLSGTEHFLVRGEKMAVPLQINFSRCDGTGSPGSCEVPNDVAYHIVQGEIFATVQ